MNYVKIFSDGMGDAEEDEYEAYVMFVDEHIDELVGLTVQVDSGHYGEAGKTQIDADDPAIASGIHEALRLIWDRWCSEGWNRHSRTKKVKETLLREAAAAQAEGWTLAPYQLVDRNRKRCCLLGATVRNDSFPTHANACRAVGLGWGTRESEQIVTGFDRGAAGKTPLDEASGLCMFAYDLGRRARGGQ